MVIVETDHKPLEAILKKPLFLALGRLQKMIMTLQKYSLEVKYRPGKELFVADTLSRAALQEEASELDYKFDINVLTYLPVRDDKITIIKMETQKDQELQTVKQKVLHGCPEHKTKCCHELDHIGISSRHEISTEDRILFKGDTIIIPNNMRNHM